MEGLGGWQKKKNLFSSVSPKTVSCEEYTILLD